MATSKMHDVARRKALVYRYFRLLDSITSFYSTNYDKWIVMYVKQKIYSAFFIAASIFSGASASPANAEIKENVIVKSKNIEITEAMMDAALQAIPAEERVGIIAAPKKIAEFLKNMMLNKTLVKEAQESGLDQSPQVLAEIAVARESIIAKARLKEYEKQVVPPKYESSAREQYVTQIEKYTVPAEIDTSHILFKTQCRTEAEALKLAQALREKIAAGKSFEEAAIEMSEDGSVKKNKGNLGTLPTTSLAAAYSAAAQTLKIAEVSQPVISEFGVHLIKLNKIVLGRKLSYEEMKPSIIAEMETKYRQTQRSKKMAEIEFDPSVELNNELLLKRGGRTIPK